MGVHTVGIRYQIGPIFKYNQKQEIAIKHSVCENGVPHAKMV